MYESKNHGDITHKASMAAEDLQLIRAGPHAHSTPGTNGTSTSTMYNRRRLLETFFFSLILATAVCESSDRTLVLVTAGQGGLLKDVGPLNPHAYR